MQSMSKCKAVRIPPLPHGGQRGDACVGIGTHGPHNGRSCSSASCRPRHSTGPLPLQARAWSQVLAKHLNPASVTALVEGTQQGSHIRRFARTHSVQTTPNQHTQHDSTAGWRTGLFKHKVTRGGSADYFQLANHSMMSFAIEQVYIRTRS